MKRTATLLAALAVAFAATAAPVRTATEAFVTNKIEAAISALPVPDYSTNNTELVETIQAEAPAPDFSTNNAALVATIAATAPAPGGYAIVSNRAMSAIQSHQSLRPATNYTDAALAAFAATGTVFQATSCGTPNRWVDATGCVWEARMIVSIQDAWMDTATGNLFEWNGGGNTYMWTCSVIYEGFPDQAYVEWVPPDSGLIDYEWEEWFGEKTTTSWVFAARLDRDGPANMFQCSADGLDDSIFGGRLVRVSPIVTNLVGRVALTNDIPDVAHSLTNTYDFATNVGLYTAVRDLILALGGSVTNFPTIGGVN